MLTACGGSYAESISDDTLDLNTRSEWQNLLQHAGGCAGGAKSN